MADIYGSFSGSDFRDGVLIDFLADVDVTLRNNGDLRMLIEFLHYITVVPAVSVAMEVSFTRPIWIAPLTETMSTVACWSMP